MTVDELKQLLRTIAFHLNYIEKLQYDEALHSTRYSQTDSRINNGGPSEPLSITNLDYQLGTVDTVIKGWCYSLANSHQCPGLPHDKPTSVWVAWLSRYASVLLTADYADDSCDELGELESQLRARIHPQEPHEIKLPDYATVDEIAQALGKTPHAVRKWCERKQVTKYIQDGLVHYRTAEIKS